MRYFQIIPISHSLKNNKIGKSGEKVSESQLTSPASELIEAGFIKEVFDLDEIEVEEEVIPFIPTEIELKKELSNDVKKEIKDIKRIVKRK